MKRAVTIGLVVLFLAVYGYLVYFVTGTYYERKIEGVSRVYEEAMVRRYRYEREHMDSVIVFIREADSSRYWQRVAEEIEFAKRVANGEVGWR